MDPKGSSKGGAKCGAKCGAKVDTNEIKVGIIILTMYYI